MVQQGILIVEDEILIAMSLEDYLLDCGFDIAGSAHSLKGAFDFLASDQFDMAILDINLGHEIVWPFAKELMRRGKKFAFLSSDCYRDDFPDDLAAAPRMCKPFDNDKLCHLVRSMMDENVA